MTDTCRKLQQRGGWAEDAILGRCTFPIGPRNCVSNLAYAVAGAAIIVQVRTPIAWIVGLALCVLAFGSAYYHGAKTVFANNWDWVGMYVALTTLAVHALFPNSEGLALGAASIATVLAAMFAFHRHFDIHMALLFLAGWVPSLLHGSPRLALLSAGCFTAGYLCWQLDKRRLYLRLYGHALWHVLTAAAMYFLFFARL
jgi:hypothetical protein